MKITLLYFSLVLFSIFSLQAQETDLTKELASVGLTADDLNHISDGTKAMNNYSYMVRSEEMNAEAGITIKEMSFDPRKIIGEKWTLLSVDGKEPTQAQLNAFDKEKNDEDDHIEEQDENLVRDEDVWIKSNTKKDLVIGFKFNKKKLHHSQKILKHFEAELGIDKKNKSIEYVELSNNEPFKMIMILNVEKMNMKLDFISMENGDQLIDKLSTDMTLSIFGEEASATITQSFYNYKKVF